MASFPKSTFFVKNPKPLHHRSYPSEVCGLNFPQVRLLGDACTCREAGALAHAKSALVQDVCATKVWTAVPHEEKAVLFMSI